MQCAGEIISFKLWFLREYLDTRFNGERIVLPNLRHVNSSERQKKGVSATLENVYNCQLSNLTGIDTTCVAGTQIQLKFM